MSDEAAPSEGPALPRCPHCGGDHPPHLLKCPDTDLNLPLEGRILHGKFRFVRLLGKGGMASVWAAVNTLVDRAVAIKLIRAGAGRNEETVARFRTEAKAAGRIGHPNVCGIIDFGLGPVGPYIVMERLRGRSVGALIHDQQRLDPPMAVAVVRQALAGLDAAHKRGIIHRDLKPENLYLHQPEAGPPVVKIMDFGVSKLTDGTSEVQTQHGALLGTPEYMSPEQFKGAASADERTDIWAMGAILYKALTGETAFAGPSVAGTLLRVTTEEPSPIETLARDVPPELRAIVERCLSKDPGQRFASAQELSRALEPFDVASLDELAPLIGPGDEPDAPAGPPLGATSGSKHAEDPADSDTLLPTTVRRASTRPRRPPRPERRAWLLIAGVTVVGAGLFYLLTRTPTSSRPTDHDRVAERASPDASGPSVPAAVPAAAGTAGTAGTASAPSAETSGLPPHSPRATTGPPHSSGATTGPPGSTDTATRGSSPPHALDPTGHHPTGGESGGSAPRHGPTPSDRSPPASTDPALPRDPGDPPSDRLAPIVPDPDEPPPTPPGTVRVGRYLTPSKQGPTSDHAEARAYCRELGDRSFAGITTWRLASPVVARKLASGARRGRYWTTALWKGNAITIALPSQKQGSRASGRSGPRPLCAARWP